MAEKGNKSSNAGWVKWVLMGCGVLVLGAVGFFACVYTFVATTTEAPRQTVEDFLAHTTSGDLGAAHDCFSAPLKEAQSFEEFSSIVEENRQLFSVEDTTLSNISVDMNSCEISGTAKLTSETHVPISFRLVEEGDTWKLISYEIGT
jgi:hypothetical protein